VAHVSRRRSCQVVEGEREAHIHACMHTYTYMHACMGEQEAGRLYRTPNASMLEWWLFHCRDRSAPAMSELKLRRGSGKRAHTTVSR